MSCITIITSTGSLGMTEIQVHDNILDAQFADEIEQLITGGEVPMFFNKATVLPNSSDCHVDPKTKEYPQFTHVILRNGESSEYLDLGQKIVDAYVKKTGVKYASLDRVKINLLTQCNFSREDFYHTPHTDWDDPHYVLIYYVNNSDGDTYIFDKNHNIIQSVSPKKNRFLLFPGYYLHAGRNPIEAETRIIFNYNLKI